MFSVKFDMIFLVRILQRLYERADVGDQNDVLCVQKM